MKILKSFFALVLVVGFCLPSTLFSFDTAEAVETWDGPTTGIDDVGRIADPDTHDSYIGQLLGGDIYGSLIPTEKGETYKFTTNGTRYAGRLWADKSVFAYDATENLGSPETSEGEAWDPVKDQLNLSLATDGFRGAVATNDDFLHVYSVLGSSQVENVYPPSPIDLVLVLDVSSSMDDYEMYDTSEQGQANSRDGTKYEGISSNLRVSRFLNLIDAANDAIASLMKQKSNNRVSVIVYDRWAKVVMPLAHYTPNTKTLLELATQKPEKINDVWIGSDSNIPLDRSYLVEGGEYYNDENNPEESETLQGIAKKINDWVYPYIVPYFDGHGGSTEEGKSNPYVSVSEAYVLANTSDINDADGKQMAIQSITSSIRIAGTNTQAGLAAGLEQLVNAQETTYTEITSSAGEVTVPRIPACIVMTDGGSNTVANGQWYDPQWEVPVQRSDHKNAWSSVVVQ